MNKRDKYKWGWIYFTLLVIYSIILLYGGI